MKNLNDILQFNILILLSILMIQCTGTGAKQNNKTALKSNEMPQITKEMFGTTFNGQAVEKYTLSNSLGMQVDIITYGGIITRWTAPNKDGVFQDVVLGYNSLDQYMESNPYFGALIGRYGNRIANGQFTLNNNTYQLAQNNGKNHLHGGDKGFDKVVWTAEPMPPKDDSVTLKLTYLSVDGEEGYPGNLQTTVLYTLTNENVLDVEYKATSDQETIVNLTQHTYFNLSGDFSNTILDHEITIDADAYLPVDETLIPTGVVADVSGTPFDFRNAKAIGKQINDTNEQLSRGLGYDHCWVLNNQNSGLREVATAYHKDSGRYLEIATTEPGIQLYTGNFLDGTLPSKQKGETYNYRTGFCLETQHYPDSPNQSNFPIVVLKPGEMYNSKTTFKFSTK